MAVRELPPGKGRNRRGRDRAAFSLPLSTTPGEKLGFAQRRKRLWLPTFLLLSLFRTLWVGESPEHLAGSVSAGRKSRGPLRMVRGAAWPGLDQTFPSFG